MKNLKNNLLLSNGKNGKVKIQAMSEVREQSGDERSAEEKRRDEVIKTLGSERAIFNLLHQNKAFLCSSWLPFAVHLQWKSSFMFALLASPSFQLLALFAVCLLWSKVKPLNYMSHYTLLSLLSAERML